MSLNDLVSQHLIACHHQYQFPVLKLFDSLKEYLQAADGLGQRTKE